MERAVVLLSGGLDSATCLAMACLDREVHALTFDYGSRHSREIEAAKAIAARLGVKDHRVVKVSLDVIGGSSLTDADIQIERGGLAKNDIPTSYVPARNIIFLSLGVALAETVEAGEVYIGANVIDYSGYPDCRPEFIEAFQQAILKGTKTGIEGEGVIIIAPLLSLSKSQIIKKGLELGVPYELTWTCYAGREKACGKCDACAIRLRGFEGAGIPDPIEYEG
jgi:7-cyano-7-deazaguanine synthase